VAAVVAHALTEQTRRHAESHGEALAFPHGLA
jgi:hypothetical protein